MSIIPYSQALKSLDKYIKEYNTNCTNFSEKLKQSTISTAKDLIRIYGLELRRIKYSPELPLPPLRTNNKYLATIANTSGRTIQRHIKRLQIAGIITHKKWRGSRASYDIHILPELLCITTLKMVDNPANEKNSSDNIVVDNQTHNKNKTTFCLHRDTSNNGYINNIIIAVDKLKTTSSLLPLTTSNRTRNATGNTLTRYTGEIALQKNDDEEKIVRNKRVTKQTSAESSKVGVTRSAFLNEYVESLWKLAKEKLYKDHYLTQSQERQALEQLQLWYEPVSDKMMSTVHQVYEKRIEMVVKYISKDSEKRFVQLPDRYFDPKNTSGFAGTKKWYYEMQKQKFETHQELILNAQIRKFKANEAKDTALQQPRLTVFKSCESKIKELNEPQLLKAFYSAVLQDDVT